MHTHTPRTRSLYIQNRICTKEGGGRMYPEVHVSWAELAKSKRAASIVHSLYILTEKERFFRYTAGGAVCVAWAMRSRTKLAVAFQFPRTRRLLFFLFLFHYPLPLSLFVLPPSSFFFLSFQLWSNVLISFIFRVLIYIGLVHLIAARKRERERAFILECLKISTRVDCDLQ